MTFSLPASPCHHRNMEYKVTSDNPHSVVYIGVRVTTSNDRLRTLVHDRELEYPYHIVRYPEWSSTAPRTQLGGVIFGRFTFAHEICSDLDGFKQAVGHILRHALYRHYPIPLLKSVWSRFLFRKWAGDVRKAELHAFFRNLLQELRNQGTNRPPDPRVPLAPLRPATLTQEYLQVFGYRPDTNQPRPAREVAPPLVLACSVTPPTPPS